MLQDELDAIIKGCVKKQYKFQKLLYEKYASLLYAICLRYLKNTDDAKDALQDGFIKIYEKIDTFSFNGSFEGWIKRLVVNNCLMILRNKKKIGFEQAWDDNYETVEEEEEDGDTYVDPKILFGLIQDLPEGYRTIFNLYVVDGFSHKEIAEKIGINEGTSKSQLARAKKLLRSKIHTFINEQERQHRRVV